MRVLCVRNQMRHIRNHLLNLLTPWRTPHRSLSPQHRGNGYSEEELHLRPSFQLQPLLQPRQLRGNRIRIQQAFLTSQTVSLLLELRTPSHSGHSLPCLSESKGLPLRRRRSASGWSAVQP